MKSGVGIKQDLIGIKMSIPYSVLWLFSGVPMAQASDVLWPMFRSIRSHSLFESEGLCTLLGVVIGFMLGEGSRYIRYRLRIARLKRIIPMELKAIRYQIYQKQDVIYQMIVNLKKGEILSGDSVRFISTAYHQSIAELYGHFDVIQRNCLHVIHETLQVVDKTMAGFEHDYKTFLQDSSEGIVQNPKEAYIGRLRDIARCCRRVNGLIKRYLAGNPIDVFYICSSR